MHEGERFTLDRAVAAGGRELPVTPSHPIWTRAGFVNAAEKLRPGDVLLALATNRSGSCSQPDGRLVRDDIVGAVNETRTHCGIVWCGLV